MLHRITRDRSHRVRSVLRAGGGWHATFPISIAGQLADLFTTAMKAHCLATLPRPTRGLLHPEVMYDLLIGAAPGS
jgi:hypothetical protein